MKKTIPWMVAICLPFCLIAASYGAARMTAKKSIAKFADASEISFKYQETIFHCQKWGDTSTWCVRYAADKPDALLKWGKLIHKSEGFRGIHVNILGKEEEVMSGENACINNLRLLYSGRDELDTQKDVTNVVAWKFAPKK